MVDQHIPVAAPQHALLQALPTLTLAEAVVAIDHLLRLRGPHDGALPMLTMAELDALACTSNQRGVRKLRLAASLSRIGSESRMETLLRLILVAYGLDEGFELQVDLSDDRGWIGRFDLVHAAHRLIVEYDGEQHRTDAKQYAKDERRVSRAWKAGYQVLRFRYPEVVQNPEVAALAVAEALGVQLRTRKRMIPGLLTWC
ncbi:endonuclease domain-containing protein [Leucobacter sp. W1478]